MSDTRGTRSNQAPAHLMFDFMQMLPQEYYEITIKFIFHIKFKYSLIPWRVPHLLLKIDIAFAIATRCRGYSGLNNHIIIS